MNRTLAERLWDEYVGSTNVVCPRCCGWVRRELAERTVKETGNRDMPHALEACDLEIVRSVIGS